MMTIKIRITERLTHSSDLCATEISEVFSFYLHLGFLCNIMTDTYGYYQFDHNQEYQKLVIMTQIGTYFRL